METTWTVVKFIGEDTVEAVPTTWLFGSEKCYWPPFPKDKIMMSIRKLERPNSCWPLHNIITFRNGTYDDYLLARNKARKAESQSDLNSDGDKKSRKLKKKKKPISSSSDEENYFTSKLPSPPRMPRSAERNHESPDRIDSDETNIYGSIVPLQELTNVDLRTSATEIRTDVRSCCCCADHKMGDTLKNLLKQQVLTRHILHELLDEVRKIKLDGGNNTESTKSKVQSIFIAFQHFPINSEETLRMLEEYLSENEHFNAAVTEFSKIGGANSYDFMKRSLSSMFTNDFASQFSWQGAKKKKIFGQLKVAELLLEAAQVCGLSKDRKSSEDGIKTWLRRARERHLSSLKKVAPQKEDASKDDNSILFLP